MQRRIPGHFSELDLALKLGMTVSGIRAWRRRNYGPVYVKYGRSVFYRVEDVAIFIENSRKA